MIKRFSTLFWAVMIVASAFGLYIVKYRVQAIQAEIAEVKRQMETEQESLHVVAAEWAYLNHPDRLQLLAQKHLKLAPVGVAQVADIDRVPFPNQPPSGDADAGKMENASFPAGGE